MAIAKENPKFPDPMQDVEVGKEKIKKYANILEQKAFKKQIIYTIKHARDHYKFKTGCTERQADVYKGVIEDYFAAVSKAIIQKNYPYLWYRIGEFFIAKFNGSPMLNSYQSKNHRKVLSYVNLHTSGWVYQFYWAKSRSVFYNNSIYEFVPCDGKDFEIGKKGVKKWIRKLHEDKHLVDYNAFVRNYSMVHKRRKKKEAEKAESQRKEEERMKRLLI